MKFGVLSYGNGFSNVGDWVQSMGVIKTYSEMGLTYEDLVKIDRRDLNEYRGEKVVLPLGGFFDKMFRRKCFPLSEDIIPVFLGFHCTDEKIMKYLGKYKDSFFGCRDLATASMVGKTLGTFDKVFMSGCFSLCLDKRQVSERQSKIYLVDVIPELFPYIPKEIKEKAEYGTQISMDFIPMSNAEADEKALAFTRNWLNTLKENAKLVITSRLHLALPCVALGIPVIVARKYHEDTDRYSGYDNLFHVYLPHEFYEIDWEPSVPDVEWLKTEIIQNAVLLLRNTYQKNQFDDAFVKKYNRQVLKVNQFFLETSGQVVYGSGEHASYLSQSQKEFYVKNKQNYNNILEYLVGGSLDEKTLVIWGAGDKGDLMMRRYEHVLGEFKDCFYVDMNPQKQGGRLNGFPIFCPGKIKELDKDKIFVIVAVNDYDSKIGREIAESLYCNYHLREGKEFFFLSKLDSSGRMAIDDIALNSSLM